MTHWKSAPQTTISKRARRRFALLLAFSVAFGPTNRAAATARWVSAFARPAEPLVAVAIGPSGGGAFAAGDVVQWANSLEGGPVERATLEDVRDLAFGPNESLWIGTGRGLFRWEAGARPERRALPGGAGAAEIRRVVGNREGLLVATGAGAYWSSRGRVFQSLAGSQVGNSVEQVGFRALHTGPEEVDRRTLWLLGATGFERIEGLATEAGLRVLRWDRVDFPRPRREARPVDLAVAAESGAVAVLYPDGLAIADGAERGAAWRVLRPTLAPGAVMRRLAWDAGGVHVATDRGLFRAAAPDGEFERVAPAPGAQPCTDLDFGFAGGHATPSGLVLCRSGMHVRAASAAPVLAVGAQAGSAPSPGRPPIPPDPPVAAIRARAWARAGLEPQRDRALRTGLARRGWWPEVGIRFGADFDRDDRRFADQAFISGDRRRLFDRTRDRGTRFEALLELDWSLGDLSYPEDSVDLSRELRQVLALRDDVSDEIHRLYFERASIRDRLAAGGPFEPGEPAKLRRRAAELAASLDAWTDGWFSGWLREPKASSSSPNERPADRGLASE